MRALAVGVWAIIWLGCSTSEEVVGPAAIDVGPGVSRSLAEHRARTVSDLVYEVALVVPETLDEAVRGTITARFKRSGTDEPLVFDFAQPAEAVHSVCSNGSEVAFEVRAEHIVVPLPAVTAGSNEVTIEFTAGDGSLNRSEEFLYSLFVPDRARVALPILDQPNLKARYRLTLDLPAEWQAVANGAVEQRQVSGDRATWTFAETEPISTYVFAFAAGRFEVVSRKRDGRSLRLLHRETDSEKVDRNLEAIFGLHFEALDWLERYTGIVYPFGKLEFIAVPAFQYGGMEHAGAIFYRDRSLFLDETATQSQILGRASLIAHEVAHMWFGNLVTMNWFDDVWMKEVFANFMAAKIVHPAFPDVDHELRFLLAHYPDAYRVDRTAGANPIRQILVNLNEAGSLYGAIIYQKAPVVMKHLESILGEESFRDGLRQYLDDNRYGNASWPDLIEVLNDRTPEDLEAWSAVWVHEPGRPTVEVSLRTEAGRIESLALHQSDPDGRDRRWNQRLEVLLGYASATGRSIVVPLREETVEIDEARGAPTPDYLLANGAGLGYGEFILHPSTQHYLLEHLPSIDSARHRAIGWLSLWDALLAQRVGPDAILALAQRALQTEKDELNVQRLLDDLTTAFWRYSTTRERQELAPALERLLWDLLESAEDPTLKGAFLRAVREISLSEDALGRLRDLWSGERIIDGLTLSENDTTAIAQALAVRAVADAEALLDEQRERITNPDSRARFDYVRPALAADSAVRDAFFQDLSEATNRQREPWVLEALSYLHHPLRAATAEKYIRPSLELLEEIQRTGDIFFPLAWLSATLGGHNSPSAAAIVERFLADRPDLPRQLRGKLLQAADPLFRAARITEGV